MTTFVISIVLLIDFLHPLANARCRSTPQLVGGQPKTDILMAVLLAQVIRQLLQTL